MASATTRATFSFPHHHLLVQPKQTHTNTLQVAVIPPHQRKKKKFTHLTLSVDVSKEDKPIQSDLVQEEAAAAPKQDEAEGEEELSALDKRRLEEKFAVLNTGVYECRSCGYKYDEAVGDPSYPVPPGLPFNQLPDDWRCSTCGAAKSFFQSKRVEIAGFEQNQQYGLGGNALTSGQKAILIYGSLAAFFALFLSGYFLP